MYETSEKNRAIGFRRGFGMDVFLGFFSGNFFITEGFHTLHRDYSKRT